MICDVGDAWQVVGKMAGAIFSVLLCLHFLLNSPGTKEEYTRGRCRGREIQLKEAINELSSARKIISILQNEFILAKASTTKFTVNLPHKMNLIAIQI
jgi:hypothetical protein